jgi:3-deoxy-7-phosphoheptulonate synthase
MSAPRIEDLRVRDYLPLMPPRELKEKLPLSAKAQQTVIEGRETIQRIINKEDKRLLAIVGPCSIHDEKAALEYA